MLTSQMIKEAALAAGADLCGIGNMERFEGAPPDMDPRYLFPEAKSVIGFAFRIPRGVQRGIEEGTQFYQYPSMAYGGINEIYAPAVLYRVGKLLEDEGYEAFLYRNTGARGRVSDTDGSEGNSISPEEEIAEDGRRKATMNRTVQFTRPVREDTVAPDLQFHFRLAGVICGLGEIGWSKMLLTPEFGPLQRVAFIFTDAVLEPDPIYDGPALCRKCMACVRECPGHCIPSIAENDTCSATIEGHTYTWANIDMWRCFAYYTHTNRYYNPFVPKEVFDANDGSLDLLEDFDNKMAATEQDVKKVYNALAKFFPSWVGYNMAKCGGCIRACVSMLEKKGGCMEGRFHNPLRTGKAWKMDW